MKKLQLKSNHLMPMDEKTIFFEISKLKIKYSIGQINI